VLPIGRRGPIRSLSAELHYTRVRWEGGSALVLYPFSAAVAEMGGGMQVHRSHWLDPAQVVALRRVGQRGEAEMADGAILPVSRPNRAAAEAAVRAAGGRLVQ
jgi:DNA-binding LytR/AlgR family response regulator